MSEQWTVQNEDLSDPWNAGAWLTNDLHGYIGGGDYGLSPALARQIADCLNAQPQEPPQEGE